MSRVGRFAGLTSFRFAEEIFTPVFSIAGFQPTMPRLAGLSTKSQS